MQFQHELTMKRLEIEQRRGLEHLGVSRETANLLTVGGTCVVVASSGAWLVSQLLTDIKVNLVSVQREISSNGENFQSLISDGHYPKESSDRKK